MSLPVRSENRCRRDRRSVFPDTGDLKSVEISRSFKRAFFVNGGHCRDHDLSVRRQSRPQTLVHHTCAIRRKRPSVPRHHSHLQLLRASEKADIREMFAEHWDDIYTGGRPGHKSNSSVGNFPRPSHGIGRLPRSGPKTTSRKKDSGGKNLISAAVSVGKAARRLQRPSSVLCIKASAMWGSAICGLAVEFISPVITRDPNPVSARNRQYPSAESRGIDVDGILSYRPRAPRCIVFQVAS